jgi:heme oxygenase (mycobilin-producing)
MGVKISAPGYRQVAGWPGGYRVATGWHHRRMTVIKINAITVPADSGDELARRFAARAGAVDNQDGFEGFELLKPTDERTTWLVVTRWRDEDSFAAWLNSAAFGRGHQGGSGPAAGAQPGAAGGAGTGGHPGAGGQDGGAAAQPVGVSSELWSYEVAGGSAARPS